MAQNDVHYGLTREWVLEVIGNRFGSAGAYVAELIAWTRYLTRRFLDRIQGDADCLSGVLRGKYWPSPALLMGFYATALLALLTP